MAVVTSLRERGLLVVEVSEAGKAVPTTNWFSLLNPFRWLPPRSADIEISLQQMAVMLRSGLTLLTTLKTIAEYSQSWRMRRTWEAVAEKIQHGASLADAMAEHRCFPRLVIQMVKVGEQTGTLEQVVTRAAEALERRRFLRTHILTAMFYPTIVFFAAIGVAAFMVVFLIPKMKVFLSALGRKLPAMTQNLVDIADFVQAYGLYIAISLTATVAALIAAYIWPPGRLVIDRLILRMPITGKLLRLALTIQFSYGLAVLLRSGITLVEGLRTVEQLHNNRWAAGQVGEARASVLRGGGLAPTLTAPGVFLPMLSRMVAVGESAGTLDDVLMEVARFHEAQLQSTIKLFSTIIEPIVIVVVGVIVGYVYIAFFLALFAAAGSAR